MTRERAKELAPIIAAYAEGRIIQCYQYGTEHWMEIENPAFDSASQYRIKPESKRRLMTRNEVLGFVAHNPHIVVRYDGGAWDTAQIYSYNNNAEWATITERGEIGEPHKFEIEDNE